VSKIGAIILAGGRGSRFGIDKCLVKIYGKFLINKQINTILKIFDKVYVVVKDNYHKIYNVIDRVDKVVLIRDIFDKYHPLSGIVTAAIFLRRKYSHILTIPVDLVNISKEFIKFLIENFEDDYDCVIPKWRSGFLEPLVAIYRIETILKIFRKYRPEVWDKVPVRAILEFSNNTHFIDADTIVKIFGDVFKNINTLKDIKLICTQNI